MKRKWIQSLPNPTNALWKNLMLYWLKLILNSDQDLALSWQKQILTGLLVTKIYKNRTMKISLFNYSMLGYIAPITTSVPHILSIEEILVQPISLNPNTRLTSSIIPPRNISDKFTIIWDLFVDFYCQVLFPLQYFART